MLFNNKMMMEEKKNRTANIFPESKLTSSDCFSCPNNNPKSKDSSFTVISDKEKQLIQTFKKLKPGNV